MKFVAWLSGCLFVAGCGHSQVARPARAATPARGTDGRLASAARAYADAKSLAKEHSDADALPIFLSEDRARTCSKYVADSGFAKDTKTRVATVDGALSAADLGARCHALAADARAKMVTPTASSSVTTAAGFSDEPEGALKGTFGCNDPIYFRVEGDAELGEHLSGTWQIDDGELHPLSSTELKPTASGGVRAAVPLLPDPALRAKLTYTDYAMYKTMIATAPVSHRLTVTAAGVRGGYSHGLPKREYTTLIDCTKGPAAYQSRLSALRSQNLPRVRLDDFGTFGAQPLDREWHGKLSRFVTTTAARQGIKLVSWSVLSLETGRGGAQSREPRVFGVLVGASETPKVCSVSRWQITQQFDPKLNDYDFVRMSQVTTRQSEIDCKQLK